MKGFSLQDQMRREIALSPSFSMLCQVGLKAYRPLSKSGRRKAAGYPDIQIEDEHGRIIYLDCKTYSTMTKG